MIFKTGSSQPGCRDLQSVTRFVLYLQGKICSPRKNLQFCLVGRALQSRGLVLQFCSLLQTATTTEPRAGAAVLQRTVVHYNCRAAGWCCSSVVALWLQHHNCRAAGRSCSTAVSSNSIEALQLQSRGPVAGNVAKTTNRRPPRSGDFTFAYSRRTGNGCFKSACGLGCFWKSCTPLFSFYPSPQADFAALLWNSMRDSAVLQISSEFCIKNTAEG